MNLREFAKSTTALLRSAAKEANILALLALGLLAIKIFIANRIPQIFPGAYEAGIIVEAILASIIASYVFYILVAHLPLFRTQMQVEPFFVRHLGRMIGDGQAILHDISQKSGSELDLSSVTQSELHDSLEKIAISSESPLLLLPENRNANWLEFFLYRANRTRESAEELIKRINLLNGDRIKLVTEIDDCSYFRMLDSYARKTYRPDAKLNFISDAMYKYLSLCRELKRIEGK